MVMGVPTTQELEKIKKSNCIATNFLFRTHA
jgi:hypothetical protein